MRRTLRIIAFALLFLAAYTCGLHTALAGQKPVVRMYVFSSADCSHCAILKDGFLPTLADKVGCVIEHKLFDIEEMANYQKLVAMEERWGKTGNPVPVVFIGSDLLSGDSETETKLEEIVAKYAKAGGVDWPDEGSAKPSASQTPEHKASSMIDFEKTEVDLGELKAGEVVKVSFSFKNAGTEELSIKGIRTACGCFVSKAGSSKLQAGQTSSVEVTFETAGLKGDFSKSVMVDSNDPSHPTVRLIIKAKIIPLAILSPERINFGSIPIKSTLEKTVIVTPARPGAFSIISIKSDGKCASVPVFEKIKDAKGAYSVKVLIKAGDTPGRVYEKLTIRANSPDGPVIPFMVFGNVVP